ncbi:MAG: hypothetical protein EAY75_15755 [Bacteroidetes bacterium]|nr:MAG: hypothetical protein EAY75_15755 [Bacteroidota bacterium]
MPFFAARDGGNAAQGPPQRCCKSRRAAGCGGRRPEGGGARPLGRVRYPAAARTNAGICTAAHSPKKQVLNIAAIVVAGKRCCTRNLVVVGLVGLIKMGGAFGVCGRCASGGTCAKNNFVPLYGKKVEIRGF